MTLDQLRLSTDLTDKPRTQAPRHCVDRRSLGCTCSECGPRLVLNHLHMIDRQCSEARLRNDQQGRLDKRR